MTWFISTTCQALTWDQAENLSHFAPWNALILLLFDQSLLQNIHPANKQYFGLEKYAYSLIFKQFQSYFPIFRLLISNIICCNENTAHFPCSIYPTALLGHFKLACKILIFRARIPPHSITLPQTSVHKLNCSFVWPVSFSISTLPPRYQHSAR